MERGIKVAWSTVMKMTDGFFALLPNLMIAMVVLFIFYMVSKFVGRVVSGMAERANIDKTLGRAVGRLASVFTNIFGLLVCAVIVVPTFSPDKLIAGLGITSVAIGFAFQNVLQNFFAGLLLLWQKPFGIGDEIKAKEYEGTVEDITIRTTQLKTFTGQRVYIPNGVLFTEPVTVNTAYSTRQVHIQLPINEEQRLDAVEVARSALGGLDSVAKDPPPQISVSAAGGSLNLDVYFWANSKSEQLIRATNDATIAIQEALTKISIEKDADKKKSQRAA
jgi:Small-conductance mechanosensitive channel